MENPMARLFVSSTFCDMHAERNHLTRVVFPEIASQCRKQGVGFSGVELRWGITEEDADILGAYELCRDEVCRCNFFISILGDRYGWVPPPFEIPENVFRNETDRCSSASQKPILDNYRLDEASEPPVFRLLPLRKLKREMISRITEFWQNVGLPDAGKSVTELEILRGPLERRSLIATSFFYFRQTDFRNNPLFPRQYYDRFVEKEHKRAECLEELKKLLRNEFGNKACRDYCVSFAGYRIDQSFMPPCDDVAALSDGRIEPRELNSLPPNIREKVLNRGFIDYDGVVAWGDQVLSDLWGAISDKFLKQEKTGKEAPRSYHEIFQNEKCSLFIGREDLLQSIEDYVSGYEPDQPLVLWGPPGSGKSTLIAEFSRRATEHHKDALVLPFYIGAAPGTTDLDFLIRSIIDSLRPICSNMLVPSEDPQKLRYQLGMFLLDAARKRKIILILDAVNQLDTRESDRQLDWLPTEPLSNIRIIVTTLECECLSYLRQRVADGNILEIPVLSVDDRRQIVVKYLERRGKKLSDDQMAAALNDSTRKDAVYPLYLVVAMEELCHFGYYEALQKRIDALPPTITELFDSVLRRLEMDNGRELTGSILKALALSRSGMQESEIRELFRGSDFFAPLSWKRLYRALEPYLRPMDEAKGEGLIAFFHDQLRFAVLRKYVEMNSTRSLPSEKYRSSHSCLARFFKRQAWSEDKGWLPSETRGLSELPYHFAEAAEYGSLRSLLLDFSWLLAKTIGLGIYSVIADFNLVNDTAVKIVSDALRLSTGLILKCTKHLAPQLTGRLLGHSDPDIKKFLGSIPEHADFPWLRPLLPGLLPAGGFVLYIFDSHPNPVNGVVLDPEEKRAVSCAEDGTVRVWDLASGAEIRILDDASQREIFCVTTDGQYIVAGTKEGNICIWDAETGTLLHQRQDHQGDVTGIALVGNNRLISVSEDTKVKIWDIAAGIPEVRTVWDHFSPINCLAVSFNGRYAVTGSEDGVAKVWDLLAQEWRRDLPHEGKQVLDAAFLEDESVCCALEDGTLSVWPADASPARTFSDRHDAAVTCIDIAAETGRIVTGSDDKTLRIWKEGSWQCDKVLRGHPFKIRDIAVSRDGKIAVSAAEDTTLMVWDLAGEHRPYDPPGHADLLTAVAVSPEGLHAVTGAKNGKLKLWDMMTLQEVPHFSGRGAHTATVTDVAFLQGKEEVVSVSPDGTVLLSDITGQREPVILASGIPSPRTVSCLGDNSLIVAGSGPALRLCLSGESSQFSFGGENVAVSPDGTFLVSTEFMKIYVHDPPNAPRWPLGQHDDCVTSVAIFPDGDTIASTGKDRKIRIWSRRKRNCVATLVDHSREVWKIRITPNGKRGVSASDDRSVILWDMINFRKIAQFFLDGAVVACDLSPDGAKVVTGDEAGRLSILQLVASSAFSRKGCWCLRSEK